MALQTVTVPAKGAPRDRWDDKDLIPVEIPRDQWDRPLIIPSGGGDPRPYRRASSYCGFEYMGGIHDWQKRHLLVNVAKRPDLVLSGQSVQDADDPATKKDLNGWVRSALDPTLAKARIGTALHRLTEQVDATGAIPAVGIHIPALTAYREVMSAWFEILHSEAFLVNDELGGAGTTDRVVQLKMWMQPCDRDGKPAGPPLPPGTVLILDLKTAGDARYFGAKFCVQFKVYHGGQLYNLRTGERAPLPELHPRWGLILHMPAGGALAELYWVDLEVGARAAELARQVHAIEKETKRAITRAAIEPWTDADEDARCEGEEYGRQPVALPPAGPAVVTFAGQIFDTIKAGHDAQRLREWIGRAASETELRDLWATNRRTWSDVHTQAAAARSAALAARVAS